VMLQPRVGMCRGCREVVKTGWQVVRPWTHNLPTGLENKGKKRKRWKEEVERDLQELGVRRWRELVADRKKWKDIVRQAKAHSGM